MKHFFKIFKSFLLLGLLLLGVSAHSQNVVFKDGIQQGVVKVKFTPAMATTLSSVQVNTKGKKLSTGIKNLDNAASPFKVTSMKRIFPDNPKNAAKLRKHGLHLWYILEIDKKLDPQTVVRSLKSLGEVQTVECAYQKAVSPYSVVKAEVPKVSTNDALPFNDPLLNQQWHYKNTGQIINTKPLADINLFEAWKETAGRSDIIVSIHDEGVDVDHEDLKDNMWVNTGEIPGDGIDNDGNGYIDDINGFDYERYSGTIAKDQHATHVAGTVAAVNNNGIGVCGVAGGTGKGDGVKIMSLKVIGNIDPTLTAKSFIYAADNGAVISQNSWGYTVEGAYEQVVLDAIDYFIAEAGDYPGSPMKGGLPIFASGNMDTSGIFYPGVHPGVLTVSAVGPELIRASYSNYGSYVHVSAPGGDIDFYITVKSGILSTIAGDEYGFLQGTSMACPHVSGVAALALANNTKQITCKQLFNQLISGTNDEMYKYNPKFIGLLGTGNIDAKLAIKKDQGKAPENITDFKLIGLSQEFASLSWKVPRDEDDGTPFIFNAYYSTEPFTVANLSDATKVEMYNKKAVGETFTWSVNDLLSETMYYFAVEAEDRWGHKSALTTVLSGETNQGPKIDMDTLDKKLIQFATSTGFAEYPFNILNKSKGLLRWSYYTRNAGFTPSSTGFSSNAVGTINRKPNIGVVDNLEKQFPVVKSLKVEPFAYSKKEISYSPRVDRYIGETDNSIPTSIAVKFVIDDATGFNLTDIKFGARYVAGTGDIQLEIYDKKLDKNNLIYSQAHTQPTAVNSGDITIKLKEQLFFEKGSEFFVVIHMPKNNQYPFGIGTEYKEEYSSYCFYSSNQGKNWVPLEDVLQGLAAPKALTWVVKIQSNNDNISKYLSIDPETGEVPGDSKSTVKLKADATKLINGVYNAMLTLQSNDKKTGDLKVPVKFTVSGQKPNLLVSDIVDFGSVFEGSESTMILEMDNTGYGLITGLNYSVIGSDFSIVGAKPYKIEAKDKNRIELKFTPTTAGNINGKLLIGNTKYKYEVNLFGVGAKTSKIVIDPIEQTVNNVIVGNHLINVKLKVTNEGEYPLKYFVPGFDTKGISNKWPTKYHSYGYAVRSNKSGIGSGTPLTYEFTDISGDGIEISKEFVKNTSLKVDLGFDFPYYDSIQNSIYITRFGFTTFDATEYRFYNMPELYQTGNSARGIISLLGLVDNDVSGKIYYRQESDKFIIQYQDFHYFRAEKTTAQMILHANGDIRFAYKSVESGSTSSEYLTTLIEDVNRKDGILVKNFESKFEILDSTMIGFDYPGLNIIKNVENGSGILVPGDSAKLSIDLSAKELYEGDLRRIINIVTNDPKNLNAIAVVNLNVVSGGEFKASVSTDTIDFKTIYKSESYSKLFNIKNSGTKKVVVDLTYDATKFTVTGNTSINPGLHEIYKIVPNTASVQKINSDIIVKYQNNTYDTIKVLADIKLPPTIQLIDTTTLVVEMKVKEKSEHAFAIKNTGDSDLDLYVQDGLWFGFNELNKPKVYNNYVSAKYNSGEPVHSWIDIRKDPNVTREPYTEDNFVYRELFWHKVTLPFKFNCYGEEYDVLYIGDNGIIALGDSLPELMSLLSYPIKDRSRPYIMAAWLPGGFETYNHKDESGLYHAVVDGDKLVISWEYFIDLFGAGTLSTQAVLNKDGSIKFSYKARNVEEASSNSAIVAIQAKEESKDLLMSWFEIFDHGQGLSFLLTPVESRTLAPGAELKGKINVDAGKVYAGSFLDSLTIHSNDPKNPIASKKIKALITGDTIVEVPELVDFGYREIFDEHFISCKIENKSDLPIKITNILNNKTDFVFSEWIRDQGDLGPELLWVNIIFSKGKIYNVLPTESLEVWIKFNPSEDDYTDTVIVVTNVGNFEIPVKGSGFFPPVVNADITPINVRLNDTTEKEKRVVKLGNKEGKFDLKYNLSVNYRRFATEANSVDEVKSNKSERLEEAVVRSVPKTAEIETKDISDEFNRLLQYTDSLSINSLIGLGGREPLSVSTKFNAGPEGFNLEQVGTWFRMEDLESGEMLIEVRAGGTSIIDALSIYKGKLPFVNDGYEIGRLRQINLGKEVTILPNEDFYVIFTYPLGIGYPQGAVSNPLIESKADRFGIRSGLNWYDAQVVLQNFRTSAWISYAAERTPKESGWLKILTSQGTIAPGDSSTFDLEFLGKFATEGIQNAYVVIESNDSNRPKVEIPASLRLNSAPHFINAPEKVSVHENEVLELNIAVVDDEDDEFTVEVIQTKDYVESKLENGIFKLKLAPQVGDKGKSTLKFKAVDSHNISREYQLDVTVEGFRESPEFIGNSTMTITLGAPDLVHSIYDLFKNVGNERLTFQAQLESEGVVTMLKSNESFILQANKIGSVKLTLVVKSDNGLEVKEVITVIVESCIPTTSIIIPKWNKVLLANIDENYNAGDFQWYKNGKQIPGAIKQFYAEGGDGSEKLQLGAEYTVRLTKTDGNNIFVCPYVVVDEDTKLRAYPNPVKQGQPVTLEAKVQDLDKAPLSIQIFDIAGNLMKSTTTSDEVTSLVMPNNPGYYLIKVVNNNIEKTFKVVVE